jgi:anti-sigma factor RsiW
MSCAECEAMLSDWMDNAIDGVLSAKDRAAFELHTATCAECSQMLADAKRGAALLEMLKSPRPEPSAALFDRILAQTIGTQASGAQTSGMQIVGTKPAGQIVGGTVAGSNAVPALVPGMSVAHLTPASIAAGGNVLPFRPASASRKFSLNSVLHTMMQPRLAMTAAMAFFSIALTLNLTGVRLTDLRASDLKPVNLKRSFYQADASVVRYYENLRVVYELESRVRDLQRSNDDNAAPAVAPKEGSGTGSDKNPANEQKPDQPPKKTPKAGSGTSQRSNPLQQEFKLAAAHGLNRPAESIDSARLMVTGFAARTNKLKEASQEGDLV